MKDTKNLAVFCLIALALLAVTVNVIEAFGTSPGTMVQLATSHVPTEEDAYFYKYVYPQMVRKDLIDMTEDDPGELMPWQFPWYGRGMVPFG
jgi:hypothetical protein